MTAAQKAGLDPQLYAGKQPKLETHSTGFKPFYPQGYDQMSACPKLMGHKQSSVCPYEHHSYDRDSTSTCLLFHDMRHVYHFIFFHPSLRRCLCVCYFGTCGRRCQELSRSQEEINSRDIRMPCPITPTYPHHPNMC